MACAEIHAALNMFQTCAETPHGWQITTHCLYPSFESVDVFVYGFGTGYRVHDLGGARREAWLHGIDDVYISRILNQEAARHQIKVENGQLSVDAPEPEWLFAAVTAVANASANAARIATERSAVAADEILLSKMENVLTTSFPPKMVRKHHHFRGKSGKDHIFDFAIKGVGTNTILISAVAPHHFSISSKYVAFSDTKIAGYDDVGRFAVFDRDLGGDDAALLAQVADLVPLKSLVLGAERLMKLRRWSHELL